MSVQDRAIDPTSPGLRASAAQDVPRSWGAWRRRFVDEMAIQDWLVVGYLIVLAGAVLASGPSPDRAWCIERTLGLLGFCVAVLVVVRGGFVRDKFVGPLAYRFAVYGTVQLSYFLFRELLPVVNPGTLDGQLMWIDTHVLHVEPSLLMDRYMVTPAVTEWFSFFYFGYFILLAIHVLPFILLSRRHRLLAEFALGMIIVYAVAHTLYMLVPGYGPYKHMAGQFQHPLPEGFWMRMVMNTVEHGGAQKDIFPSLHTAGPTYLVFFSIRHRRELPFKYTWPFVTFFVANIVIATLYLRWHYLIDVLVGLLLAAAGSWIAARVAPGEVDRRDKAGLTQVWPPFFEKKQAGAS